MWHDHLLTILGPSNTNTPSYTEKDLEFSDTCELLWERKPTEMIFKTNVPFPTAISERAFLGPQCAWTITAQMTETQKREAPNHTSVLFVVRVSANQTFYPNIKWSIHRTSHTSAKNMVWPLSSWSGSKDTDKHTVEGASSTVLNVEGPSPGWNPCKAIRAATLERNHTLCFLWSFFHWVRCSEEARWTHRAEKP